MIPAKGVSSALRGPLNALLGSSSALKWVGRTLVCPRYCVSPLSLKDVFCWADRLLEGEKRTGFSCSVFWQQVHSRGTRDSAALLECVHILPPLLSRGVPSIFRAVLAAAEGCTRGAAIFEVAVGSC